MRVALGAQRRDVLWVVWEQIGGLLFAGVSIGLLASVAVARLVASMLYQVRPAEFGVFGVATLAMILISILATIVPARRALRVPAVVALQGD